MQTPRRVSFWLDSPARRRPARRSTATRTTDLVVVGGGLSGLWAAIQAKEDEPARDVVLLEAQAVAHGATGHSGGFIVVVAYAWRRQRAGAVSRGDAGARAARPRELRPDGRSARALRRGLRPGAERRDDGGARAARGGVARRGGAELRRLGHDVSLLDARRCAPRWTRRSIAPACGCAAAPAPCTRRSWRGACSALRCRLGVRMFEGTAVTGLRTSGAGLRVTTPRGTVAARTGIAHDRRLPLAGARRAAPHRLCLGLRAGRPSRWTSRGARRSDGRTARGSATPPTSSTTTG